jgi:branched-subunit amino acid transport protein
MTIVALIALAVGTYLMKSVGPFAAAGRELPPWLDRLATLLPAALLAALVATQTVGDGATLTVDARLAGVGAAAVAVACRAPFGVVVLAGAGVTALIRLLGWG